MLYTCTIDTPLGNMTAAAEGEVLVGLWFEGQKYYPSRTAGWVPDPDRPVFGTVTDYLGRYFSGSAEAPDIPLDPQGSPFQKAVWSLLRTIPMGQVVTYGQIAKQMAQSRGLASMSAQAVGGAVGHNPISILIPCHRVVGARNALTGYAGGLDRKAALLRLEKTSLGTREKEEFPSKGVGSRNDVKA
jgi:methylated-DNA-[protein]-cysteine S-methyltransferase